jgi:hypothetical protein
MIHFGHRWRENLASLTRKDFAVKQDSDGALYVYKTTDEQTKNLFIIHVKSILVLFGFVTFDFLCSLFVLSIKSITPTFVFFLFFYEP